MLTIKPEVLSATAVKTVVVSKRDRVVWQYVKRPEIGIAIGDSLKVGTKSTAIGYNANAKSNNGVAVGVNAQTIGDNALAIGTGRNDITISAQVQEPNQPFLGYTARADGSSAVAIERIQRQVIDSIAMGNGADATQSKYHCYRGASLCGCRSH